MGRGVSIHRMGWVRSPRLDGLKSWVFVLNRAKHGEATSKACLWFMRFDVRVAPAFFSFGVQTWQQQRLRIWDLFATLNVLRMTCGLRNTCPAAGRRSVFGTPDTVGLGLEI